MLRLEKPTYFEKSVLQSTDLGGQLFEVAKRSSEKGKLSQGLVKVAKCRWFSMACILYPTECMYGFI
jgi:hypothetical protein